MIGFYMRSTLAFNGLTQNRKVRLQHGEKYGNFTEFPGVEILWKGTVSTPGN